MSRHDIKLEQVPIDMSSLAEVAEDQLVIVNYTLGIANVALKEYGLEIVVNQESEPEFPPQPNNTKTFKKGF